MNTADLLSSDNLVPLILGLAAIYAVFKLIRSVINRILSLAATALVVGGGHKVGIFDGLGNTLSDIAHFFN
ncbi:hypothetical protein P4N68_02780 [Corynebacterium felinum]|uniref:Uncharacterized protein n=1 Tax=Corynebacterium felinum TaxID=131318 RepID=A0ABU2BAN3_9CORY|nr:hypothetical protein [Corynebacterium felinum]MDF5820009.1 hypothetical protein [Corynebacterium felinum]MDR7355668.1 hypothetical protein [Corynebacterium felinum]WJY95019.1 hypothetical protein CFELI_07015 [Corynebacterium felinum]